MNKVLVYKLSIAECMEHFKERVYKKASWSYNMGSNLSGTFLCHFMHNSFQSLLRGILTIPFYPKQW